MLHMTTKNGPTLKPGAASLYNLTEKAPAVPPWLPGVGAELRARLPALAPVRFRSPADDGAAELMVRLVGVAVDVESGGGR